MPIKASADKLKREMEIYGYPPKFPEDNEVVEEKIDGVLKNKNESPEKMVEDIDDVLKNKSKGKKVKREF